MPYLGNTVGNRFVASKAATQFSGDGSTTAFTLDHAVGSDEDILVSVDGVIQEPSVAYAVSNGTTLTFTAAPSNNSGNNIFVYYLFRTVATVDHPSTSSLQATDGTFTGDLTVDTSTLKVDSTNNRVGIGTTSPSSTLTVNGATAFSTLELASTSGSATSAFMGVTTDSDLAVKVNGSERMRIDANGHVTMQSQPAFLVTPANNQLNLANHTVFIMDNEIFDQNSDFDTSNYTFTAPVTGRYQLQFVGRFNNIDKAGNWVRVELVTSNRYYQGTLIDPGVFGFDPEYWSTFTIAVLADMDAGDTAFLQWGQSGGAAQADLDTDAQFSGFLVC